MRPEHTEAGIARLPGFLDYIAATIGAEARRVAEHRKETSYVVSAFLDDIPNLLSGDRIPRRIDFRWWNSDGRLGAAQVFKLTHPAGKYLTLHDDDGDYEADCPIPDKRDLEFEIAVLFRDDGADRAMVPGNPWTRINRSGLDSVANARVYRAQPSTPRHPDEH